MCTRTLQGQQAGAVEVQHSSYRTAIREIFNRRNQGESGRQLRLHFVFPVANLKKKERKRKIKRRKEGKNIRRMEEQCTSKKNVCDLGITISKP